MTSAFSCWRRLSLDPAIELYNFAVVAVMTWRLVTKPDSYYSLKELDMDTSYRELTLLFPFWSGFRSGKCGMLSSNCIVTRRKGTKGIKEASTQASKKEEDFGTFTAKSQWMS